LTQPVLALVGPTASGKSALAMAVARAQPDVELVAVDSMQVYRGMDIGTAKPSAAEQAEVPHHGIDLADPSELVTVVRYRDAADEALAGIAARGHRAVLVGGTGLYLRAVIDRLEPPGQWPEIRAELDAERDSAALHGRLAIIDPAAAAKIDPANHRRTARALEVCLGSGRPFSTFGPGLDTYPPIPVVQFGLRWPRAVLAERITARYESMMAAGFLDEVRRLPTEISRTAGQALGYRELREHLDGRTSLDEAIALAIARTRRFATRQERWFRRDPRIRWIDLDTDPLAALPTVLGALPACV
jgi:tRNA dimethylallyltransferase